MSKVQIANVLLSDEGQFAKNPTLLYRSDKTIALAPEQGWLLKAGVTYDFTTFFNALSVAKYREYTVAKGFFVEISLAGGECVFEQTRAHKFSKVPEVVARSKKKLSASATHMIKLKEEKGDVLLGFTLTPTKDVRLLKATYFADVVAADIKDVHLALSVTTFKKESYITANIERIRASVIADAEFKDNFTMHVVDNGRTLDAQALSHDGVIVHPNPNVGGSGGFARGMMEVLAQKPKATHIILMDDDVVINPESIKRTYYLLRILNKRYKDAFLSGAMMHIDQPNYFFEDAGYVHKEGYFCASKPQMHMDKFHNIVRAETVPIPMPYKTKEDTYENYAAWWYCVIPCAVIKKHGLPLPFFVRSDDVEYSRRVNPKIMTLNGIVVWHEAFDARYAPAQERYQMPRNILVMRAASTGKVTGDFFGHIHRQFFLELRKFNYTDAALILEGVEDYLKGPKYFMEKGVTERRFMDALKHSEKLVPLEKLRAACNKLGVNIDDIAESYLEYEPELSTKDRMLLKLSDNGYKFAIHPLDHNGVEVIDSFGFRYPRYRIFGADTLIVVDPKNNLGAIRKRDKAQYKALFKRYKRAMKQVKREDARLKEAYRRAFEKMITHDFWKSYLDL